MKSEEEKNLFSDLLNVFLTTLSSSDHTSFSALKGGRNFHHLINSVIRQIATLTIKFDNT